MILAMVPLVEQLIEQVPVSGHAFLLGPVNFGFRQVTSGL
jgi:hypothetical protein